MSVKRGLERDRITGAAEPEYKSKRGYTVHAAKAMAGHPIWDMTRMTPEKVQEMLGPMTKEQLEAKIQQANTVIQTYKSQQPISAGTTGVCPALKDNPCLQPVLHSTPFIVYTSPLFNSLVLLADLLHSGVRFG